MEDQQAQRRMNEAAEKFAEAIKESYQALSERSVSAQELNAQLTQDFFNGVIDNLRTQAENNRALAEDLIEQQRKQQEASQALTQESVNAYMDFLNSMFALRGKGTRTTGVAAQGAGLDRNAGSSGQAGAIQIDARHYPVRSWEQVSGRARTTFGASRTPGYAASARRT
jgi:hypothetical protein